MDESQFPAFRPDMMVKFKDSAPDRYNSYKALIFKVESVNTVVGSTRGAGYVHSYFISSSGDRFFSVIQDYLEEVPNSVSYIMRD